jgi:hypothetical protein
MSSRSFRSFRPVVAAALALLLLGACERHPAPTGYGDTTQKNFHTGCVDSAKNDSHLSSSEAEDYCKCSYTKIVKQIPFDEFKKINSDLSDDPGPLPDKMLTIRDDCLNQATGTG